MLEINTSVKKQTGFYNLFDYWSWDETQIDRTLDSYGWERAVDTKSTWRIGDGTAAFYNYIYYRDLLLCHIGASGKPLFCWSQYGLLTVALAMTE